MNDAFTSGRTATSDFGIGQPVKRKEDAALLKGEGRYTDDITFPGQVHAVMVRSRYAHGVIRKIDAATGVKYTCK